MKVRKVLSICTIFLCAILIGYVGLITTGLMLTAISTAYSSGSYPFIVNNGGVVLYYNTVYSYAGLRIGQTLNACIFIFVSYIL